MPSVCFAGGLGDGIIGGRVDGYGYRSGGSTALAVGARNRISGCGGRADRNAGGVAAVAPTVTHSLGGREGGAFASAKSRISTNVDAVGTTIWLWRLWWSRWINSSIFIAQTADGTAMSLEMVCIILSEGLFE